MKLGTFVYNAFASWLSSVNDSSSPRRSARRTRLANVQPLQDFSRVGRVGLMSYALLYASA